MAGFKASLLRALTSGLIAVSLAACGSSSNSADSSGVNIEPPTSPPPPPPPPPTGGATDTPTGTDITIFESGQVRPLAMSPAGDQLYAVNTPDNRLEIFNLSDEGPVFATSVPVGLEPVAAAQNAPFDPQLTAPGVGRADVWVFDTNNLGAASGGTPVTITNLFSDVPRALAVSPDGNTVYAAAFHSGNQTTTLFADRGSGGLDLDRAG